VCIFLIRRGACLSLSAKGREKENSWFKEREEGGKRKTAFTPRIVTGVPFKIEKRERGSFPIEEKCLHRPSDTCLALGKREKKRGTLTGKKEKQFAPRTCEELLKRKRRMSKGIGKIKKKKERGKRPPQHSSSPLLILKEEGGEEEKRSKAPQKKKGKKKRKEEKGS